MQFYVDFQRYISLLELVPIELFAFFMPFKTNWPRQQIWALGNLDNGMGIRLIRIPEPIETAWRLGLFAYLWLFGDWKNKRNVFPKKSRKTFFSRGQSNYVLHAKSCLQNFLIPVIVVQFTEYVSRYIKIHKLNQFNFTILLKYLKTICFILFIVLCMNTHPKFLA